MTRTIGNEPHVADTFVASFESLNRDPTPFWGYVHVRDLELRQHPAWHTCGLTLERTCADAHAEHYRLVREPYAAFRLRLQETPVAEPHPECTVFTATVKFRHPATRTAWWLCLTHHNPDRKGRTRWERMLDGTAKVDHFVADKDSGVFRPCQSAFEQTRVVSSMELDLPVGLMGLFCGKQATASV